ncbi:MAG TPA: 4Fe-4S binding protein [Methanothermobacter sp.]|nr:F420-non-reducing hydrogenase, subunit B, polyferredoxin [Methanothermobacter sp. MT-2]HHW04573.1 4Fe-4S binding protein [Methanothermobacter sp.]HOK72037.1 4Fe-4S binding protein [Methanothermobacter sp.]HOL68350.1 4Fe-4S binding protein [Methanothermobacter sp.]HPQ04108.1 4Fe-4S binding protein [Methanothermobacter sp.]
MIIVNKEDCIRCGACEGTCPSEAIEVTSEDVIYCDLCDGEPKCVEVCPNGALSVGDITIEDDGEVTQSRIVYNPEKCQQCGDCVEICPPQILKLEEGKVQKVPLKGFCVMCQKCVDICPVGVIGIEGVKEPEKVELEITEPIFIIDCVGCGTCVDECPVEAITLDEIGGTIEIDEDLCIKCGVCSQTCPWNAVYISGRKPEKRTKEIKKFELDEETCIGCNTCVEACPGNFIEAKASSLSVELPEICAACGLCEELCPVDAITLDVEWGPAKPTTEEGVVWDEEKCRLDGACAKKCPNEAIRVVTENGFQIPGKIKVDEEPSYNMCTRCGACTVVCPNGALILDEIEKEIDGETVKRNRIVYNPTKCQQCGTCIEACPYDMLKLTEEKVPLKGFCILCDQCIDVCPNKALSLK